MIFPSNLFTAILLLSQPFASLGSTSDRFLDEAFSVRCSQTLQSIYKTLITSPHNVLQPTALSDAEGNGGLVFIAYRIT